MPTIKQSASASRAGLTPADAMMPQPAATTIVPSSWSQMSPFMHCAMPTVASTYDSLSRQFYGNTRVPNTRILPPR